MVNREFLKGVAVGALLTGILTVGGFAGWMKATASDSVVNDKNTRAKLEYLEQMIDVNYLEEKDEEALAEGLYTGLLYGWEILIQDITQKKSMNRKIKETKALTQESES